MRVVVFQSRTVMRTVIAIAILLVTGASAAAQERLFGVFNGRLTELDTTRGRLGRPVASIALESNPGLFPVAGGRFLAFIRSSGSGFPPIGYVHLIDLRTGQITQAPLPGFYGGIAASDSRVPRLYVHESLPLPGRVAVVDLTRMTTTYFPSPVSDGDSVIAYSPLGPLFVGIKGAAITVLDLTTGETRSIAAQNSMRSLVVDPAGVRVYVAASDGIFVYDLVSGALLASNAAFRPDDFPQFTLRLDPTRNRVIVTHDASFFDATPTSVAVLNAGTLALEAIVPLRMLAGLPGPVPGRVLEDTAQFEFTARRDALYLASAQTFVTSPGGIEIPEPCRAATLTRLDATSGAVLERSDVTALARSSTGSLGPLCGSSLVVVRAPEPPTASGVTMSGAVDITWTDPGNATHFEVEAGTAPGQRDIGVFQVVGTRLLVQRVPPGTYHVRVRAINDVGRSLPSNDVTIVVP